MTEPVYACMCAAVTASQVRTTILAGASTVTEIGERCEAGTGCGGCTERLQRMLDEHAQERGEAGELQRTA